MATEEDIQQLLNSVYDPVNQALRMSPQPGTYVALGAGKNALATAATILTSTSVVGDANDRFQVQADGTLNWGPGNGATDFLMRRAAGPILEFGPSGTSRLSISTIGRLLGPVSISAGAIIGQGYLEAWSQSAAVPIVVTRAAASQSGDLLDLLASDGVTKLLAVQSSGEVDSANTLRANNGATTEIFIGRTGANGFGIADGSAAGASHVTAGATMSYGTGAPVNASGANGDIYINQAGGALTTIYQRRAGAWVGIV